MVVCGLFVAGACSGGGKPGKTQNTIGPAGGSLSLPGGTKVEIPAGALSSATPITIAVASNVAAPASATVVGTAYLFGPEGTAFAASATVTLPFMATRLPAGKSAADIVILTAPAGSSSYVALPTTLADASHVQTTTTHFSVFVPAVVTTTHDGGTTNDGDSDGNGGGAVTDAAADTGDAQEPAAPVVLVPFGHIGFASTIAVDDAYVYWTSGWVGPNPANPLPPVTGMYVMRVPKGGGTATAIYESTTQNQFDRHWMSLSSTSVYLNVPVDVLTDSVMKVAKDGSTAVRIAQSGHHAGGGFGIDSQRVYWEYGGGIQSVPLDGGAIATVVDHQGPKPIEPGSGNEVPFQGINGLMSDGTNLYYSSGGHMMQVPVGGGVPRILFRSDSTAANNTGYAGPSSWPCVTGGFVYWTQYGFVFKTPVGGGDAPTPFAVSPGSTGSGPQTLTDGVHIYFLDGGLKKVSVNGGAPVTIAEAGGFSMFAIDDTSAYLIALSGNSIVKVPK
jgi:hypothetical protein